MKDRFSDDQQSKPNAGVAAVHSGKGNASIPSAGLTPHAEKAKHDEADGRSGLSKPSHGGHVREEKRDENTSNPQGADDHNGPVPQECLHLDKLKAHAAGTHEPKPKGKYQTGESTTKVK